MSDSHSHSHDHRHVHASIPTHGAMNVSFGCAVAANLLFTIFEAILAFKAESVGLLADAGHNLSDVLGLVLAWFASYLVTKKAGSRFSYGYRRTTILAAFINAVVLVMASLYIAVQSLEKIWQPAAVDAELVVLVALVGILINGGAALLFIKQSHHDLNIKGAFLHLAFDALISAGVVISGLIIYFTGALWIDPLVGLIIVAFILMMTWRMLTDALRLILDAVPPNIDVAAVTAFLQGIPGVTAVHDLHIWAMSTQENCLTEHLVMPDSPLWDKPNGYEMVSATLAQQFSIHHVTLQVERSDSCQTQDCNEEDIHGL